MTRKRITLCSKPPSLCKKKGNDVYVCMYVPQLLSIGRGVDVKGNQPHILVPGIQVEGWDSFLHPKKLIKYYASDIFVKHLEGSAAGLKLQWRRMESGEMTRVHLGNWESQCISEHLRKNENEWITTILNEKKKNSGGDTFKSLSCIIRFVYLFTYVHFSLKCT